mgnify:CR=1 FL=1
MIDRAVYRAAEVRRIWEESLVVFSAVYFTVTSLTTLLP